MDADEVVVLGAEEVQPLLELAVLLVGHQVDRRPCASSLPVELLVPLRATSSRSRAGSWAASSASRAVDRRGAAAPPGPAPRGARGPPSPARSSSVEPADEAAQVAARTLAQLGLDRPGARRAARWCSSRDDRDLGLEPVALGHRVARAARPCARARWPSSLAALGGLRAARRRPARCWTPNSRSSSTMRSMSRARASTRSATVASSTRHAVSRRRARGLVALRASRARLRARPVSPLEARPPLARLATSARSSLVELRRGLRAPRPRAASLSAVSVSRWRATPLLLARQPTRGPSRRRAARSPAPGSWTGDPRAARRAAPASSPSIASEPRPGRVPPRARGPRSPRRAGGWPASARGSSARCPAARRRGGRRSAARRRQHLARRA